MNFLVPLKGRIFQIVVFWVVTTDNLLAVIQYLAEQGRPKDEDIIYLGNAGIHLNDYRIS